MDSHTRRQVLAVAAVATGGMAGCLGSESSVSRSESATEGRGGPIPDEQAATDPPTVVRRGDAEQPPIRLADASTAESNTETDSTDDRLGGHGRDLQHTLIDSTSMADRLVVDTGGDDDIELASFVDATTFDTETLYLETRQIEQCFRLSLCYISWQSDRIRTSYSRLLRPYNERCAADTTVFESRLFRLPVAVERDAITGYGSSTSSGRCGPQNSQIDEGQTNESQTDASNPNQSTEPAARMTSSSSPPDGGPSQ